LSSNHTKRLTLVRHANAEQDADVRDFERPLSRKGQNEALEMARRYLERSLVPDLILASAATRTRETAETFAKVLGVIGHNPGISAAAISLAPEAITNDLPTCGTLTMNVSCPTWNLIDRRCVRDSERDSPRKFFDFS
jgi:phosphohistidine phosphatase SixA